MAIWIDRQILYGLAIVGGEHLLDMARDQCTAMRNAKQYDTKSPGNVSVG